MNKAIVFKKVILAAIPLSLCFSCGTKETGDTSKLQVSENWLDMETVDEFTCAKQEEAIVLHLDLHIKVNFDAKTINGKASYTIENKTGTDKIFFDTRNMDITKVTIDENEAETVFALGEPSEIMGRALEVKIAPATKKVHIYYTTHPDAVALQWLVPQQTQGKKYPFLFTQSEPAMARSWVPGQDSPGIRITYNATVEVPEELMAVMSAGNPQVKNDKGIYYFEMKQKIPLYLIALAAGDIVFKPIGARTGVYAEPGMIDSAIYEFGELEEMLTAVEKLYGPYRWERYDLIVLPPSFPFGGMENPRLTFVTPTILAGDRSLTTLVAHELSHSWSGNLVTNATWNDFWLNEGFTVYIERRIMEELYGRSYVDMLAMLSLQDLRATIEEMGEQSEDTHLKLKLKGRDPDVGMTDIAYEKGAFFLQAAEEAVGREKWDNFLRKYFDTFSFQNMSSEKFVSYLRSDLIKGDTALENKIAADRWIFGPGLPDNCPAIMSDRFDRVDSEITRLVNGVPSHQLSTKEWTTHEWLHFIRHLPESVLIKRMREIDNAFSFTKSNNSEVLSAWLILVINHQYKEGYDKLEVFLTGIGRRKFLKPLYTELSKTKAGLIMAQKIYKKARPNYHSVSTTTIDDILDWKESGRSMAME